jgi:hypothetical protein
MQSKRMAANLLRTAGSEGSRRGRIVARVGAWVGGRTEPHNSITRLRQILQSKWASGLKPVRMWPWSLGGANLPDGRSSAAIRNAPAVNRCRNARF